MKIEFCRFSLFCLALLGCNAQAQDYASMITPNAQTLATSGASGGINIPNGNIVADGVMIIGFNNSLDSQFATYARGDNYQFALGLAPFLEFSGRLANFPLDNNGALGIRDLSANVKVKLPQFFRYQPNIAFGINDLGGGAPFFNSKYVAVSESVGPFSVTVGGARGRPYLSHLFAGASFRFGNTGFTLLAERNNNANFAGIRYASRTLSFLNNSSVVFSAQRSFGAYSPEGARFSNTSLGINLHVPIGQSQISRRRVAAELEPIWVQPEGYTMPALSPHAGQPDNDLAQVNPTRALHDSGSLPIQVKEKLGHVRAALVKAGLERVRVGMRDNEMIAEFENHRYNQNEVDAIGVALGGSAMYAPESAARILVVAKKSGLPIYGASVDRVAYRMFLVNGAIEQENIAMNFQFRPLYAGTVIWEDSAESGRGISRFRIDPSLNKFVGTDVGVFDYSLAANIQGFFPLWKGAEIATSYFSSFAESTNVAHGIYGFAQQRSGLRSAVLSQSFWITNRILNVASVGKFMYDDTGVQLESVYLQPNSDDQFRLKYTNLRHSDRSSNFAGTVGGAYNLGNFLAPVSSTAGAVAYLWNYRPLNISVDASYNKYAGGDFGPTLQINRWFGDVQAQVFMRRSNLETKVGFGLAFPLTPRQGMKFGVTHVEGSGSFPLRLETRYAREGQCNCITTGIVQEMPMVYSSSTNLLNQGRIGKKYMLSQLQRMREAAFLYANLAQ